jgi:lipopolysaccharide assembly protein A
MKGQWNLILSLIFALIIAIFAVINVESVTVNYMFGEAEWPLILVILGSALMGGLIVGTVGVFRMFLLTRRLKGIQKENEKLKEQLEQQPLVSNQSDMTVTKPIEDQKDEQEGTLEQNEK